MAGGGQPRGMLGGVDPSWLCEGAIGGADYGIEIGEGWADVRCLKEPVAAMAATLRACAVAVKTEGMWLARARSGTPFEAEQIGR